MHSRNQSASSNSKKENTDDIAPMEKRRKVAGGKLMAPTSTNLRTRNALSAVNAGPTPVENNDTSSVAASDAGSSIGTEFTSREDVEKLLAERMKGKFKTDFKGKNEQMVEYIKKLKICIKWLMEIEDGYILELGNLRSLSESEEKRHTEIETQLKNKVGELNSRVQDLEKECANLQEKLRMEETQKLALIKSCKEEVEARVASDNTCAALSEELKKTNEDLKRSSEQFKNLQETTKRLQEYNTSLQQYNSNLQADAAKNAEALSKLQTEKNAIMESISSMRDHNTLLKNQLESSKASQQEAVKVKEELQRDVASLKSELQHVREDRDNQSSHMQLLKAELDNYKEIIGKTSEQLDTITAHTNALEATCASQKMRIQVLELQLEAANESLKRADITTTEAMAEYSEQKTMIQELQNRVAYAENQIFEGEKLRKKLHNTILELKGNIRVFCRVRPPLPDNDDEKEAAIVSYPTKYELLGRGIDLLHHDQKYSFTFDKVFDHKASQEDVFIEISQLVQSALDGYKVCIFAYGQTGSGKTYTMMGQPEASSKKGLIPRSLEQIFETSQSLQSLGWRYKMQASMLEIYNETIRDLLAPSRSSNHDSASQNKQHTIKHDPNGNTYVTDLTIVDVCSIKEVSFLLRQAAQSRSVGKTQMNEQSSRSHFVFTLRISGVNENTEQQVQGVLNLIDLAGSERIGKSGAVGDRLKETQAINKSLSALSDVIFAIAKKEDHVPYRNSKLTYLLQPCLGGDSKTLMFVNVSPEMSSSGESICSLRFAARVNACEIGVPHRQTQMKSLESRLSCG